MKKIIIAVDGYSSCGKSTFAKMIANYLHYTFIDTGAMYRSVTLYAIENNIIQESCINEKTLQEDILNEKIKISQQYNSTQGTSQTFLNGQNIEKEIRTLTVSNYVSNISSLGFVRSFLVKQQQEMGRNGGVVMDGRDVGTTVFPHAELKLFMTASPEIRAKRRLLELQITDPDITYEKVHQNIIERDYIDKNRTISPLRKADNAIIIDNSEMTLEEQMCWFKEYFKEHFS